MKKNISHPNFVHCNTTYFWQTFSMVPVKQLRLGMHVSPQIITYPPVSLHLWPGTAGEIHARCWLLRQFSCFRMYSLIQKAIPILKSTKYFLFFLDIMSYSFWWTSPFYYNIGVAPQYLLDIVKSYQAARNLRSSSINLLTPYSAITKGYGQRAFQYAIPKLWNSLTKSLKRMSVFWAIQN